MALLSSAISMVVVMWQRLLMAVHSRIWDIHAAPLVGAAAATFGLISAVMVGGPVGRRLIVKYNLKPDASEISRAILIQSTQPKQQS